VLLRVNPDVETDTHPHISTGDAEHKFGMTADALHAVLPDLAHLPGLRLAGFSMHIGSQLLDPAPFVEGVRVLADFVRAARPLFTDPPVVDIGGGFGVAYAPSGHDADPAIFARAVGAALEAEGLSDALLLTEPGRWLVANASILVARVEYVKRNAGRTFVVLDAGMNDLIRPALYGAAHAITLLNAADAGPVERLDIVGPVCESSDVFAVDLPFPVPREGNLIAILTAGAYSMSMASTYNSRPLPAEAACIDGAWHLIRARMTLEEMVGQERFPLD
jgi:diaminopimelate decarboxylase